MRIIIELSGGKRDLDLDYENRLETISWFDGDMANWVKVTNCFPQRATKKLRLRDLEVKQKKVGKRAAALMD